MLRRPAPPRCWRWQAWPPANERLSARDVRSSRVPVDHLWNRFERAISQLASPVINLRLLEGGADSLLHLAGRKQESGAAEHQVARPQQ
jgi:hypothetical protein